MAYPVSNPRLTNSWPVFADATKMMILIKALKSKIERGKSLKHGIWQNHGPLFREMLKLPGCPYDNSEIARLPEVLRRFLFTSSALALVLCILIHRVQEAEDYQSRLLEEVYNILEDASYHVSVNNEIITQKKRALSKKNLTELSTIHRSEGQPLISKHSLPTIEADTGGWLSELLHHEAILADQHLVIEQLPVYSNRSPVFATLLGAVDSFFPGEEFCGEWLPFGYLQSLEPSEAAIYIDDTVIYPPVRFPLVFTKPVHDIEIHLYHPITNEVRIFSNYFD